MPRPSSLIRSTVPRTLAGQLRCLNLARSSMNRSRLADCGRRPGPFFTRRDDANTTSRTYGSVATPPRNHPIEKCGEGSGALYSWTAVGVARSDPRRVGPRAVPAVIAGAGIGLIRSGLFVTDYVGGLPDSARTRPTRTGQLHDLGGILVFAGILVAAAVRGRSQLSRKSGIYQRISIAAGLGWLSAVSLRGLSTTDAHILTGSAG
jgi:hypothetical protein